MLGLNILWSLSANQQIDNVLPLPAEWSIRYFLPMFLVSLLLEVTATSIGNFYYEGYLIYFTVLGGKVPLIILMGWTASLYLYSKMGQYIVLKFYMHAPLD